MAGPQGFGTQKSRLLCSPSLGPATLLDSKPPSGYRSPCEGLLGCRWLGNQLAQQNIGHPLLCQEPTQACNHLLLWCSQLLNDSQSVPLYLQTRVPLLCHPVLCFAWFCCASWRLSLYACHCSCCSMQPASTQGHRDSTVAGRWVSWCGTQACPWGASPSGAAPRSGPGDPWPAASASRGRGISPAASAGNSEWVGCVRRIPLVEHLGLGRAPGTSGQSTHPYDQEAAGVELPGQGLIQPQQPGLGEEGRHRCVSSKHGPCSRWWLWSGSGDQGPPETFSKGFRAQLEEGRVGLDGESCTLGTLSMPPQKWQWSPQQF